MKNSLKNAVSALVLGSVIAGGAALAAAFNAASPYADPAQMKENEILHVPTGTTLAKKKMLDMIASSRVIYIGEPHASPEAHLAQIDIIRALNEKFPGKITVGMEMFRRDSQATLDKWISKETSASDFKSAFCKDWKSYASAYAPLFNFLHEQSIPVIGLKAKKSTEDDFRSGKNHADSPEIPDIDLDDPHYGDYFKPYFKKLGHDDATRYFNMMAMWDESMAQRAAEFLDDPANADRKLVVIAGTGHVQYGFGIPKRVFRRHPESYSIIIPIAPYETSAEAADGGTKVAIPLPRGEFLWRMPDNYVDNEENFCPTS